jgi:hypothetical protein
MEVAPLATGTPHPVVSPTLLFSVQKYARPDADAPRALSSVLAHAS